VSDDFRQYRSLLKLLAVARRTAEAERRKLVEREAARASAADALERLEAAIRTEEAVALGRTEIGFRDLAGYLAGAGSKRAALIETCRALDGEIAAAREAVSLAEVERRKLDHLVERAADTLRKRRDKKEAAALDEAGRRHAASRSGRF
jgi:flagellar biosynthesis chaperone FliJ